MNRRVLCLLPLAVGIGAAAAFLIPEGPAGVLVPPPAPPDATDGFGRAEARLVAPAGDEVPASAAAPGHPTPVPETRAVAAGEVVTIRVRALDALSQEPLPGALVRFSMASLAGEAATDTEGWIDTGIPSPGRGVRLVISAAGHRERILHGAFPGEVTVALVPATTLEGFVVDAESGEPVAGAELSWQGFRAPARSLADGSFVLADFPVEERTDLTVRAEGYGLQSFPFTVPDRHERHRRTFHLQPARQLAGRVVDLATGTPVTGARVWGKAMIDETDADGRTVLESVPLPGQIGADVHVQAPGYCEATGFVRFDEPFELRLPRAAALEGVVRAAGGQPAPGVDVVVPADPVSAEPGEGMPELAPGWSPVHRRRSSSTDPEGSYRVDGLVPWTRHARLEVWPDGAPGVTRGGSDPRAARDPQVCLIEELGPPGGTTRLDLTLDERTLAPSGGSITGVVRRDGRAISAVVRWRSGARSGTASTSGAAGPYRIEGVLGRVELQAAPVELAALPEAVVGGRAAVVVRAEQTVEQDLDLQLDVDTVSGRVVDGSGRPVPDVQVVTYDELPSLGRPSPTGIRSATGRDGGFVLQVAGPVEDYWLSAGGPFATWVRAAPGDTDVVLVRHSPSRLRVRAVDAETGAPVTTISARWLRPGDAQPQYARPSASAPDPDGWIEFEVPAGRLDLSFLDPAHLYAPVEGPVVDTSSEGTVEVEIEMERGLTLELRYVGDPTQAPASADALLLLAPEHHPQVDWTRGFPAPGPGLPGTVDLLQHTVRWKYGTARLRGLRPGVYRFLAPVGRPVPDPPEIELRESGQVVEVRWDE